MQIGFYYKFVITMIKGYYTHASFYYKVITTMLESIGLYDQNNNYAPM